jgi:hypothetical protein
VLIGLRPINSFSDDDKSRACQTIYPMVKKEVLGRYPWRCSMVKKRLSRLTDAPNNEWTYAFQLPSDRMGGVRAIFETDQVGARPFKDYDIYENTLMANVESIWCDYQKDVSESQFAPHLQVLMSYVLAARLAEILTDDRSKAEYWHLVAYGSPAEKAQGGYYEVAKNIDSQQRPSQELSGDFSLIDVRV